MTDDFSQLMTPLDQKVSSQSLQLIKLLIPFLPPQSQRTMAVYVKFIEFQNTLSFFRAFRQKKNSPEDIFDSLKPYLPNSAIESVDNIMNMMQMMSFVQEMQGNTDSATSFNPMSMMADMLTPEQKDIFQTYQSMFAQETTTDSKKEGETDDGLVK